jgi:hypothetical protein
LEKFFFVFFSFYTLIPAKIYILEDLRNAVLLVPLAPLAPLAPLVMGRLNMRDSRATVTDK